MLDTYNPILGWRELLRRDLLLVPLRSGRSVALVFVRENQVQSILMPGRSMTIGRLWWDNYDSVYQVDVSEHPLLFECTLPSSDSACPFIANIQLTCRVTEPAVIVQRQITDVGVLLHPLIIHALSLVSRDYALQNHIAAEQTIGKVLRGVSGLAGFEIRDSLVRLDIDAEEREHARQRRYFERQQQACEWEHVFVTKRAELDGERAQKSIAFYNSVAKQGYDQLLLMYLIYHPEDLRTVTTWLNEQRLKDKEYLLPASQAPGASATGSAPGPQPIITPPPSPGPQPPAGASIAAQLSPPSTNPTSASGHPAAPPQPAVAAQPNPAIVPSAVVPGSGAQSVATPGQQARAVGEP